MTFAFSVAAAALGVALAPAWPLVEGEAPAGAQRAGRPGVDTSALQSSVNIGDFVGKKVDLGFEPSVLQLQLMATGALHDGGAEWPNALSQFFPTYHKCEECGYMGRTKALLQDECYVCPVIFCAPCEKLPQNANVLLMKPFEYCARTQDNPHYPKTCSQGVAKPLGEAFMCVDDKGKKKKPEDCNPLYAMIGNGWTNGGINMPNLALLVQSIVKLFAPGLKPALEPDYFVPRPAYRGALLEPYPFLTPGATPNNLAPPL